MEKAQFGVLGLGSTGRNFLLNAAKQGIRAIGYDHDRGRRDLLTHEDAAIQAETTDDLTDLVAKLETPRNLVILPPNGWSVDDVIAKITPHLEKGDLMADGGDSHCADTDRRIAELASTGIGFMGFGVVRGWQGGSSRRSSIMAGGRPEHYARMEPLFNVVATEMNGPCAGYVGTGSAGHFVKMAHDAIECALMQQTAEIYDYMRRILRMNIVLTREAFLGWHDDEMSSNLFSDTIAILNKYDPDVRKPLVELILDTTRPKDTAKWAVQAAIELGVPVPTIQAAIAAWEISARKSLREDIAKSFQSPTNGYKVLPKADIEEVRDGLYCGFFLVYEQAFSLLRAASEARGYGFDLPKIAYVWRYGSTVWSTPLTDIRAAMGEDPSLSTILLHGKFSDILYKHAAGLRRTVASMSLTRIPASALSASLNYYTSFRTERLPSNLIEAQRDCVGSHAYRRIDKEGIFHTDDWDDPTLSRGK